MYITGGDCTAYTPGLSRDSAYKAVWRRHWPGFREAYQSNWAARFGPLDERKVKEVKKLLGCGVFSNGFRLHECHTCGVHLAVPFSCKSRLCLSCHRKRLFAWSLTLSQVINPALTHNHITFTIPGRLSGMLFRRGYKPTQMVALAARLYIRQTQAAIGGSTSWRPGVMATVHACGNSLNYNPHVHMVASRDLVHIETGEIKPAAFIAYKQFMLKWQESFLSHLMRRQILTKKEAQGLRILYPTGFHVHFKKITGSDNDVIFKTAEYIAAGFFHNSQIKDVDHKLGRLSFKHRARVNQRTGERFFATKQMPIQEFMARMLYFLPEKHEKMIRYYGLYALAGRKSLRSKGGPTWALGIQSSFTVDPEVCPRCDSAMTFVLVFSRHARRVERQLKKSFLLIDGYFYPMQPQPP